VKKWLESLFRRRISAQQKLDWQPKQRAIIADLERGTYFEPEQTTHAAGSQPVTNLLHILAVGPLARLLDQGVYCALNCLRRLAECPEERTPHALAISKTVPPGNFLGGEAASLHHQPRRFDAQPFNCLRG
jgi:hypothetical protein